MTACVFFALGAIGIGVGRLNLIAAGLFCCAFDWFLHAAM